MSPEERNYAGARPINVGRGKEKYPIVFATVEEIAELVASLTAPAEMSARQSGQSTQSVVIIADATAQALYREVINGLLAKLGRRATLLTIPSGERHKNGKRLLSLLEALIASGIDRSATILAFGGGVTTDIAGCVAALLLRGVRWIAIPTTFLGMIDAAIGGKTGVNSEQGKNLIGAFWPPQAVIVAPEFIRTQRRIDFEGSLAEALKYYAISGKPALSALRRLQESFPGHDATVSGKIIAQCARIKARVVSADERERGARAFLNFGHTIGHALEFCGGYRHISHGRAVAAGMIGAIALSLKQGLQMTPEVLALEEYSRSLAAGAPVTISREEALSALMFDKKRRSGKLMFVLLAEIGKPYLSQAPDKRTLNKAVELSIGALTK